MHKTHFGEPSFHPSFHRLLGWRGAAGLGDRGTRSPSRSFEGMPRPTATSRAATGGVWCRRGTETFLLRPRELWGRHDPSCCGAASVHPSGRGVLVPLSWCSLGPGHLSSLGLSALGRGELSLLWPNIYCCVVGAGLLGARKHVLLPLTWCPLSQRRCWGVTAGAKPSPGRCGGRTS